MFGPVGNSTGHGPLSFPPGAAALFERPELGCKDISLAFKPKGASPFATPDEALKALPAPVRGLAWEGRGQGGHTVTYVAGHEEVRVRANELGGWLPHSVRLCGRVG